MTRHRWTASKPLHRSDGDDVHSGDMFEPSAAERRAFGHKMERIPSDETDASEPDDVDASAAERDAKEDETPSNDTYPRSDLESMDYDDLRTLASDGDHPDVDGRSPKADIIDAYADSDDD